MSIHRMSIHRLLIFRLHHLAQHHRRLVGEVVAACRVAVSVLLMATAWAAQSGHAVAATVLAFAAVGAAWAFSAQRELAGDALTGLPTRPAYTAIMAAAARWCRRGWRVGPLSVALVDADGLHQINHVFGHAAGDQYLGELADRLRVALPAESLLLRLGGDEFAVLIPGEGGRSLAAAIETVLGGQTVLAGNLVALRASAGVVTVRDEPAYGLALADAAQASAKLAGGNRVLVYDAGRDGVPDADGTRPRQRRRDLRMAGRVGAAWQPGPGSQSLLLPVTHEEGRALLAALRPAGAAAATPVVHGAVEECASPAGTDASLDAAPVAALAQRLTVLITLAEGALTRREDGRYGRTSR